MQANGMGVACKAHGISPAATLSNACGKSARKVNETA
jgi:hypothetical protein